MYYLLQDIKAKGEKKCLYFCMCNLKIAWTANVLDLSLFSNLSLSVFSRRELLCQTQQGVPAVYGEQRQRHQWLTVFYVSQELFNGPPFEVFILPSPIFKTAFLMNCAETVPI